MMLVHGEPPYVSAGGFDFGKEHNKRLALLSPAALDFNVILKKCLMIQQRVQSEA